MWLIPLLVLAWITKINSNKWQMGPCSLQSFKVLWMVLSTMEGCWIKNKANLAVRVNRTCRCLQVRINLVGDRLLVLLSTASVVSLGTNWERKPVELPNFLRVELVFEVLVIMHPSILLVYVAQPWTWRAISFYRWYYKHIIISGDYT
jgi:hypothetical protein